MFITFVLLDIIVGLLFLFCILKMLDSAFLAFKYVFVYGITSAIAGAILAPIQFLKIIKQQQNEVNYSEIFNFYKKDQGYKVFFRGAIPYAIMQFISSASFGFSEFLINNFILKNLTIAIIYEILLRSALGSILETIATVKFEVLEISRNKKEFLKGQSKIIQILGTIFIRNSIFWIGAVFSYKFSEQMSMNFQNSLIFGLIVGVIFSFISVPFDVIATQNCGADIEQPSIIKRAKEILFHSGLIGACSGMLMRIIQIALYTAVTAIVAKYIQ